MMQIHHTNIYKIGDYSRHLKALTPEDKVSRFGYPASDHAIDQLILNMCYHPNDHELWYARDDGDRVGWGHMANNADGSWELAVSVNKDFTCDLMFDTYNGKAEFIYNVPYHSLSFVDEFEDDSIEPDPVGVPAYHNYASPYLLKGKSK